MAATWQIQIQVRDRVRKEVSVNATRTDGADVRAYLLSSVIVGPGGLSKQDIATTLWQKHQEALSAESDDAALISTWQEDIAALLDAQETV